MRLFLFISLLLPSYTTRADTINFWYISHHQNVLFADNQMENYYQDSVIILDLSKLSITDTLFLVAGGCINFANLSQLHKAEIVDSTNSNVLTFNINERIGECKFPITIKSLCELNSNSVYRISYANFSESQQFWISCFPRTKFKIVKKNCP